MLYIPVHVTPQAYCKSIWTPVEDARLKLLVELYGYSWCVISGILRNGRSGKQCRERYVNHLAPGKVVGPLSDAEKEYILRRRKEIGNKWTRIASELEGRTAIQVKNFYYSDLRLKEKNEKDKTYGFGFRCVLVWFLVKLRIYCRMFGYCALFC